MPCLTPYRGDTSQMLLFKIASCLEANPGGGGVTSFNGQTGAVILSLADVAAVADGRYVLKSGDTMTGALVHPDGTAALPSITFTGDLDTGIYHPAANTVGLSAGGTLILSVLSTGIGVINGTAALPSFAFTGDLNTGIYRVGADTLGFTTAGVLRVELSSAGNLGIGTLPTGRRIEISGNSGDFAVYAFSNFASGSSFGFLIDAGGNSSDSSFVVRDRTSSLTYFRIRGDGNVGIGTASPSSALTLATSFSVAFNSGANQRAGDVVLVAGTVTTANTKVTANTRVYTSRRTAGGVLGNLTYTIIAATSFTITSDNIADTSTVSYLLIEVP